MLTTRREMRETFSSIHFGTYTVDISSMLGVRYVPNSFEKQLVIKSTTLSYYTRKLKPSYKFDVVYSTEKLNDVLYLLCNMCQYLFDKQLMFGAKDEELVISLIQRWIKGARLLHKRHALRYDRVVNPHGVIDPIFDLLYHALKSSYSTCNYVRAYESIGDYQAQMWPLNKVADAAKGVYAYTSSFMYERTKNLVQRILPALAAGYHELDVSQKSEIHKAIGEVDLNPILVQNKEAIHKMITDGIKDLPLVSSLTTIIKTIYGVFNAFFDGLKDMFSSIVQCVGPVTRSILIVCGFIALFYFCYKIGSGIASLAFRTLSALFFKAENVIIKEEYLAQMCPTDDYECQMSFSSLSTGIVGLLGYLSFSKWDTRYVSEINSKLSLVRSLTSIYSVLFENLVDIYRYAYSNITGKPFFQEDIVLQKFDELLSEFYSMTTDADIARYVRGNPEAIKRVMRLYKDMVDYDKRIRTLKSLTPMQQTRWTNMLSTARIWNNFCSRKATEQVTRVEPVWINICGPAGVGKSVVVDHLINAIFIKYQQATGGEVRAMNASDRYERKVENEYWDGYDGQFAVTIDDLYQTKLIEQRSLQSTELIHMCNNTAFPLHMSTIEEKSNTMFTSPLIVTTTNDDKWQNIGISCVSALYRRVTIPLLKLREEFPEDLLDSTFSIFEKCGEPTLLTRKVSFAQVMGKENLEPTAVSAKFKLIDIVDLAVEKMLEKRKASETFLKCKAADQILQKQSDVKINLPSYFSKDPGFAEVKKLEKTKESNPMQEVFDDIAEATSQGGMSSAAESFLQSLNNKLTYPFKSMRASNWAHRSISECAEHMKFVSGAKPWATPLVCILVEESNDLIIPDSFEMPYAGFYTDELKWEPILTSDIEFTYAYVNTGGCTMTVSDLDLSTDQKKFEACRIMLTSSRHLFNVYCTPYVEREVDKLPCIRPEMNLCVWYHNAICMMNDRAKHHMDTDILNREAFELYTSVYKKPRQNFMSCKTIDDIPLAGWKMFGIGLATVSAIAAALLGAVALWKYLKTSDYDAQSIDKSHIAKNLKVARGKHFSRVNEVAQRVVSKKLYKDIKDRKADKIKNTRVKNGGKLKLGRHEKLTGLELNENRVAKQSTAAKQAKDIAEKLNRKAQDKAKSKAKSTKSRYRTQAGEVSDEEDTYEEDKKLESKYRVDALVSDDSISSEEDTCESFSEEDVAEEGKGERDFLYDSGYESQMSISLAHLANKFALNTKPAFINYEGLSSIACYMFFVKGTIACTASHYMHAYEATPDSVSLFAPCGQETSVTIPWSRIQTWTVQGRDIAYFNFPPEVPSYRNLTKFIKPFVVGMVQPKPARVEWTIMSIDGKKYNVRSFISGAPSKAMGAKNPLRSTLAVGGRKVSFLNEEYYHIPQLEGYAGACGLPYMDYSDEASPLMGIHVAGKDDISVVAPIKLEDFDSYKTQCSFTEEISPLIKTVLHSDLEHGLIHVCPEIPGVDNLYQLERKHYIPSQTQIVASMLMDYDLHEPTMAPAALSGTPSPLDIAMDKYSTKPFEYMPILDDLNDDRIFEGVLPRRLWNHNREFLTLKQAIEGCPRLGIPAMDLSTGVGEPFTQFNVTTKQLFDRNRPPTGLALKYKLSFHVDDAFLLEYERVKELYEKEDELPPYPVNDTLKDETRPLERVLAHKTRLFDAGAKVHMLIMKQYLGHLVADIEKNRHYSDIQVGINVHSVEWTDLWMTIQEFVEYGDAGFMCGDFDRWDKSVRLILENRIGNFYGRLYQESESWIRVVCRFIRAILLAVHFNPKGVYVVRGGMSSGCFITSILNSTINSVIHRLGFNYLCPHLKWEFDMYVRLKVYGDDSVAGVRVFVRGYYNMKTFSAFCDKVLGMTYTTPMKTLDLVPFVTVNEVSFLKRSFGVIVVNDVQYVTAQLEKDSIHNSILYTRKFKTKQEEWEALCSTCDSYLMEYLKYGKTQFEAARRRIHSAMNEIAKCHSYPRYHYDCFDVMWARYVTEACDQ